VYSGQGVPGTPVWQLCEETKWTVDETLAWIEQTEPARAQHYRR